MVSFVEKGKTDAIVNGTVIKDVEIETEVTVKNVKTNVEYKSDKEAEKRFMTTAELNPEDYNSGDIPWHIDTVCLGSVKDIMKETKEYFTNLLGCNKPVKWLRVNDDGVITRVVTRYTKEYYGVS
jgi:hypothetical protein